MLAYLAHRPVAAERRSSPNLLLLVIAGHVAAVAVVMSVKMDLPKRIRDLPTQVHFLPSDPQPVEAPKPRLQSKPQPALSEPQPVIPIPADPSTNAPPSPPLPLPASPGPVGGSGGDTVRQPVPATPAVLLTGAEELKPPYPSSKLASGEEAVLKLRLTVGADGRVVAVEPLGRADPAFLNAARRHILAHWRYRPATSDGHDVAASLVVTLRFQLDE